MKHQSPGAVFVLAVVGGLAKACVEKAFRPHARHSGKLSHDERRPLERQVSHAGRDEGEGMLRQGP